MSREMGYRDGEGLMRAIDALMAGMKEGVGDLLALKSVTDFKHTRDRYSWQIENNIGRLRRYLCPLPRFP
jgi:hypothetical protein